MKKFVSGVIVGIMLFAGASAFADSVGIIGKKVTGTYTIKNEAGERIADAAIIEGSAYAPVRALSAATGTELVVEGKEIIMSTVSGNTSKGLKFEAEMQVLETQKMMIEKRLLEARGGVNLYDTDIIPRAEEYARNSVGTKEESQHANWLSARKAEREKYAQEIVDLEKQLTELNAQIAELQK